jgi:Fe-S oxidoreductase
VIAWLAGAAPALVNRVAANATARRLVMAVGAIAPERAVPQLFGHRAARKALQPYLNRSGAHDAVLFIDTFTRAFRPELAGSAGAVLADSGLRLRPAGGCCALTWITTGQLATAKRVLARTARRLDATGSAPIVVLEPSCAAALHEDLPKLVPSDAARRVADRITTFAGIITDRLDHGWQPPPQPEQVMLQQHCHEYAVFGASGQQKLLKRLGVEEVRTATGCCGLAGNFGFEREHYDVSIKVADLALTPALADPAARVAIAADGFSCQTQIHHLNPEGNPPPAHLAQLLARALPRRDAHDSKGIPR